MTLESDRIYIESNLSIGFIDRNKNYLDLVLLRSPDLDLERDLRATGDRERRADLDLIIHNHFKGKNSVFIIAMKI